ncbi:MAG: hypothetical protein ACYDG2_18475 [Ruminiclostridium sp.]
MLESAITLCVIIGFSFLILLVSILLKWKKTRLVTGMLMSLTSIIAMILFVNVQKANGNPDAGMEFEQLYFPILVFVVFIAIGFVSTIKLVKNL